MFTVVHMTATYISGRSFGRAREKQLRLITHFGCCPGNNNNDGDQVSITGQSPNAQCASLQGGTRRALVTK